ncbi:MAG: pantetheine-phosphate adenylyltransferase [Candidatus Thermoplasmatota archaeon]|nr:pantetheine-phosphate adenylyltransferase [Candidatus Thermoplasmatota archaeon]MBS3789938.1 pantetheine-phosphate adenylyltransferase [Candidatus Thermoplasmatota archaeon]
MDKKIIVGGTFDHLHLGHEKLLRTALNEGETTIGLVSDRMLEEWKPEVENSYEERKKELERFLSPFRSWSIVKINNPYEKAVEGDFDVLVVSYETRERGEKINEMRKEKGKKPLQLIEVDPVLAEDLLPISSTRIREGDIDEHGKRLKPVRVFLGSENPIKKESVREALSEYFDLEMVCEEAEGVEKQPFNEDIIRGAKKRAKVPEGFDYGVGVESGIVQTENQVFSLEYVVIKDRFRFTSTGHGPGFPIPESWTSELKSGITLGKKMKAIFEDRSEKIGAVDLLTDGQVEREDCIKSACFMAMIPRLKSELYR